MTGTRNSLSREDLIEQFGERAVQHSEWGAEERDRVHEIVDNILAAIEDRDDVELAKTRTSISRTGEHEVGFDLTIAGEPWEYHSEDAEETVYKCGACECVYSEPQVTGKDPEKDGACPSCGTPVQDESTKMRIIAF
jgi:hypothetical protein